MMKRLLIWLGSGLVAWAAPVNVAVTVGGQQYVQNGSTPGTVIQDWTAVTADTGTGFALGSPGAGSIWLTGNPYGLTNTTFTCLAAGGCSGFGFVYTLLGVSVADIMTIDVAIEGSTTADALATVFLACTSTASCPYNLVSGQAALSGVFGSTPLLSTVLALFGPPPSGAVANVAFFMNFQPVGGGSFPAGTVIELPNSLTVTLTPEPATWAVSGAGVLLLLGWRLRRSPSRCSCPRRW